MNFLLIHMHDAGRYTAPYGYGIPTPAFSALAEESVLFRRAFSCAPTCSPSRAAMLTGMYPHEAGMLGLAHRGFSLDRTDRHLAHLLSYRGWDTVLSGVQHEVTDYRRLGYVDYIGADPEGMFKPGFASEVWDAENARAVLSFLKGKRDKPFFLFWGLYNPHRPYPEADTDESGGYIPVPAGLPDHPAVRGDMAGYVRGITWADRCIGRVLKVVRTMSEEKQPLVIVTTDHGIAFPGHKCTLKDTGCSVVFILRPSGGSVGRVIDTTVSHLDVVPTVLDYAGFPGDYSGEGVSLKGVVQSPRGEPRHHGENFSEINYHAAYEPMRAVRTERWKYIRNFHGPLPVPANIDDSPTKDLLWKAERGIGSRTLPEEELYDLLLDPDEGNNLAGLSEYVDILEYLRQRLHAWMERTYDPLLVGPVVAPSEALVNSPEDYSPQAGAKMETEHER